MQYEYLKVELSEWTDIDIAAFTVGVSLSLMDTDDFSVRAKHVFWTENPVGDMLYDFVSSLVKNEILEENEDQQVRWNSSFIGSWQRWEGNEYLAG